jgi:hypothetical protein
VSDVIVLVVLGAMYSPRGNSSQCTGATVDGHRKLPTGGHLWRILWPWFLPAYGQIVPHLL